MHVTWPNHVVCLGLINSQFKLKYFKIYTLKVSLYKK